MEISKLLIDQWLEFLSSRRGQTKWFWHQREGRKHADPNSKDEVSSSFLYCRESMDIQNICTLVMLMPIWGVKVIQVPLGPYNCAAAHFCQFPFLCLSQIKRSCIIIQDAALRQYRTSSNRIVGINLTAANDALSFDFKVQCGHKWKIQYLYMYLLNK